jgi:hypothetical protein
LSDNVAVLDGYTREIMLTSGAIELYLMVKPGVDLDSCFKAWDTDQQEFIRVNGWLFEVES